MITKLHHKKTFCGPRISATIRVAHGWRVLRWVVPTSLVPSPFTDNKRTRERVRLRLECEKRCWYTINDRYAVGVANVCCGAGEHATDSAV